LAAAKCPCTSSWEMPREHPFHRPPDLHWISAIPYTVVVDGTFRRAEERRGAVAIAQGQGVDSWIVECSLPEVEIQRRLEQRLQEGTSVSDGRWEVHHEQLQAWQPVAEVPTNRHICLDTTGTPQESIHQLLQQLLATVL